jgi:hypothetical protein
MPDALANAEPSIKQAFFRFKTSSDLTAHHSAAKILPV